MSEVVTSIKVRKCDRSQDIRLESYLLTGVGHATEVVHTTRVVIYPPHKKVTMETRPDQDGRRAGRTSPFSRLALQMKGRPARTRVSVYLVKRDEHMSGASPITD
jgi:hypothetical protein